MKLETLVYLAPVCRVIECSPLMPINTSTGAGPVKEDPDEYEIP